MNIKTKKIVEQYALSCTAEQEKLLLNLGTIPAPSRQEYQRAEFCKNWFIDQGATDVTIDKAKNVICKIGSNDHEKLIVFMAHMDIVFPDMEPLQLKQEGRKLYAPGIGDDTANLVNLMMACKYLINNSITQKYGFLVVANSCEEGLGNSDGCKEIFAAYGSRIEALYSFDGYLSHCCNQSVGSYRYKVSVKTPGGHSYFDFGASNAIEILCGIVKDLYKMEIPTHTKTTFNVGYIEGGTTVNTIAQEANILFEFRSTANTCLLDLEKQFSSIVDSWRDKGGEIKVELLGVRPGDGPINRDELNNFTEKSKEIILNFSSGEYVCMAASTDANIPLSLGIMANTIGTVRGDKCHTREEWIDMDSMPNGLKIVLSLMLEYTDIVD